MLAHEPPPLNRPQNKPADGLPESEELLEIPRERVTLYAVPMGSTETAQPS